MMNKIQLKKILPGPFEKDKVAFRGRHHASPLHMFHHRRPLDGALTGSSKHISYYKPTQTTGRRPGTQPSWWGRSEEKRSAVVWIQHEQSRIRSLALGQESIYRTGTGPQCGGIASCVELRNGCFARKHFEPNRAGERCGVPYLAILLLVQAKEALTAVDDDALLAELGF